MTQQKKNIDKIISDKFIQDRGIMAPIGKYSYVLLAFMVAIMLVFFFWGGFDGYNAKGRSLTQDGQDSPSLSASHALDALFTPANANEVDGATLDMLDKIRRNKIMPLSQINSNSIYKLPGLYADYNYFFDLETTPKAPSIPRMALANIPGDSKELQDVDLRKSLFIQNMLPLVLKANENIMVKRTMALRLLEEKENGELNEQHRQWLRQFYQRYRVEVGDDVELLKRLDVIPVSLALAQAAIESAWGTSRFAIKGNALFGQWTWSKNTESIAPKEREEGKTHAIKAFATPLRAVESYMLNLNRHRAYEALREARAKLREAGQDLTPAPLIAGLTSYSEKGTDYLDMLHAVINQNNLTRFDNAQLAPLSPVIFPVLSLAW